MPEIERDVIHQLNGIYLLISSRQDIFRKIVMDSRTLWTIFGPNASSEFVYVSDTREALDEIENLLNQK